MVAIVLPTGVFAAYRTVFSLQVCGRYASYLAAEALRRTFRTINPLLNLAPSRNVASISKPTRMLRADLSMFARRLGAALRLEGSHVRGQFLVCGDDLHHRFLGKLVAHVLGHSPSLFGEPPGDRTVILACSVRSRATGRSSPAPLGCFRYHCDRSSPRGRESAVLALASPVRVWAQRARILRLNGMLCVNAPLMMRAFCSWRDGTSRRSLWSLPASTQHLLSVAMRWAPPQGGCPARGIVIRRAA
jgi:hypothetical protein